MVSPCHALAAQALTLRRAPQGHCWPGALPQSGAHVLPRRAAARGTRANAGADARTRLARAGAAAAIIVYDITNNDSFARAKSWVRRRAASRRLRAPKHALPVSQVRELQRQGNASLVMALTGNKADLTDKRKVEAEARARARVA